MTMPLERVQPVGRTQPWGRTPPAHADGGGRPAGTRPPRPRAVVACAQPLLLHGLRHTLEGHVDVSGAVPDLRGLRELLAQAGTSADLCLVVPPLDVAVLDLLAALRADAVSLPVVVLAAPEPLDGTAAVTALRLGAAGWLPLDADVDRLPHALLGVVRGETALPRAWVRHLVEAVRGRTPSEAVTSAGRRVPLTDRERDVLDQLRQGRTAAEAARALGVSAATVRGYSHALRRKLEVATTADVLRAASTSSSV